MIMETKSLYLLVKDSLKELQKTINLEVKVRSE